MRPYGLSKIQRRFAVLRRQDMAVSPEHDSPSLSGSQCSPSAITDHLAFVFGKYSQHLEQQPVGVRHIAAFDLDVGIKKQGHER